MTIFEKLAAAPSLYRARACFQLAQADLHGKQFAACEEKCRQLWGEGSLTESSRAAARLSAALEGLGEYGKAA